MIALGQARQHLETLGLKQAVEILDNTLDVAANKQLTYPEMLEQLLGAEVAARRERYLSTRTTMAHLSRRLGGRLPLKGSINSRTKAAEMEKPNVVPLLQTSRPVPTRRGSGRCR